MPRNVRSLGHVGTREHNAFNTTPLAVLNIARDSMAAIGFSPATRVFEAAGAGAYLITDSWEGIELFLKPEEEVLVARDGADVVHNLRALDRERSRMVGEAGRRRIPMKHALKLSPYGIPLDWIYQGQVTNLHPHIRDKIRELASTEERGGH